MSAPSHSEQTSRSEPPRMELLTWWAAHLAEHEAAGNHPVLILAGVGAVWGLWFSLRCPGTATEIGHLLEGTSEPPPSWLCGCVCSAQLDPLWPLLCFQVLSKGRKLEASQDGRLDVLFGPMSAEAETGTVLPTPTSGPETVLQEWGTWHQEQFLQEARTVLVYAAGCWRMWASLGVAEPLHAIIELLLEPRPDRPSPARLPLDIRWRGGSFAASDLSSAEIVLSRALDMRAEASPWLHLQLPEAPKHAATSDAAPTTAPDPRGVRARRTLELLIAAVALYQRAELDGADKETFGAIATIGLALGGPLFPVVRDDFRRYVREQLGAAAPRFWTRVQLFVASPCHDIALEAARSQGGPTE